MSLIAARRTLIKPKRFGIAGFTPTSVQSGNFLARVGTALSGVAPYYGLSSTEAVGVDAMITGIVTDLGGSTAISTWPILDWLHLYATINSTVGLLNLTSGSFNGTIHGTVTHTPDAGVASDGTTGYIDTGFTPSTSGGNMAQNSCSIGVYNLTSRTTTTGNPVNIGTAQSGGVSFLFLQLLNGGNYESSINYATYPTVANANAKGAYTGVRTLASTMANYKNGSATSILNDTTNASTGLANFPIFTLALNFGSATDFTTDQLAAAWGGGGLTGAQAAAIHNRINTYLALFGKNVF